MNSLAFTYDIRWGEIGPTACKLRLIFVFDRSNADYGELDFPDGILKKDIFELTR
jgi:hypothetical protein